MENRLRHIYALLMSQSTTSQMTMKLSNIWSTVSRGILVILCTVLCITNSLYAQGTPPKVTAEDVSIDPEKLQDFVAYATHVWKEVPTLAESFVLFHEAIGVDADGTLRDTTDWRLGNIFVILLESDGTALIHGQDPNLGGRARNLLGAEDDNGKKVVEELLKATMDEPLLVEYCWNDPTTETDDGDSCKVSYAMRFTAVIDGKEYVMVSGYYQDLSQVGITERPDFSSLTITAADVKDKETLKEWVLASADWLLSEIDKEGGLARVNQWKGFFREEGGPFRSGTTYFWAITSSGFVIYHINPRREGRYVINNTDSRGNQFMPDIIRTAQEEGGGFIEYYWDDPTVDGDEGVCDTCGSLRIAYVIAIEHDNEDIPVAYGDEFILGGVSSPQALTSIEDLPGGAGSFEIGNYPNPFSRTTNLYFNLEKAANIEISVIDVLGRTILTNDLGTVTVGARTQHEIDTNGWPPGVYFYRVIATTDGGQSVSAGKMMRIE